MANSRSARKRIRANEHKHVRNRAVRSSVRTKVIKARRALFGDEAVDTQEQVLVAVRALDRAAEKGILHRNNAARRKSRLMALASRLRSAASSDEEAQTAVRAAALGGQKGRSSKGGARSATPKGAAPKGAASKAPARKAAGAPRSATAKPATGARGPRTGKASGTSTSARSTRTPKS